MIFPGGCFNVLVAMNLGDDTHSLHLGMRDEAQNISLSLCLLQVQYTPAGTYKKVICIAELHSRPLRRSRRGRV